MPLLDLDNGILKLLQVLVVLWMTRDLTDEVSGWGALFHGLAGDGTVSVCIKITTITKPTYAFIIPDQQS